MKFPRKPIVPADQDLHDLPEAVGVNGAVDAKYVR